MYKLKALYVYAREQKVYTIFEKLIFFRIGNFLQHVSDGGIVNIRYIFKQKKIYIYEQ